MQVGVESAAFSGHFFQSQLLEGFQELLQHQVETLCAFLADILAQRFDGAAEVLHRLEQGANDLSPPHLLFEGCLAYQTVLGRSDVILLLLVGRTHRAQPGFQRVDVLAQAVRLRDVGAILSSDAGVGGIVGHRRIHWGVHGHWQRRNGVWISGHLCPPGGPHRRDVRDNHPPQAVNKTLSVAATGNTVPAMESQNRLMFPLAALLLGLVALIVLAQPTSDDSKGSDAPGSDQQGDEHWTRLLPGLEASDVSQMQMTVADGDRTFVREEDGWRITAPIHAAANDDRVDGLVNAFTSAEGGDAIAGEPKDFGLAPPAAKVVLTTKDGKSHELQVGNDAPVGWHSYVRVGSDGPIQATRSKLSPSLGTSIADLRVHALWSFPESAVDKVEVDGPDVALQLHRDHGEWWVQAELAAADGTSPSLAGPVRRANPDQVHKLLGQLSDLKATGFLDETPVAAADLPWSIHVTAAGAMQTVSAGVSPAGTWMATGPQQPGLVTLEEGWNKLLVQPVTSWWATDSMPIDGDALASLSVQLGEHRLEATRSDAGWSPDTATTVVEALGAVRVDRAQAPVPQGDAWGKIVLTPDQGDPRELDIYQQLDDGARVAVDRAGGPPFRISAVELGRISTSLPGTQG